MLFFSNVRYDETADEVFISNLDNNIIQVYSSMGEHKRTITLPQGTLVRELTIFDDHSLFFLDFSIESQRAMARRVNETALPANDYVIPDYRRTLYWNPMVTSDETGKAKIIFYNNSTCKDFNISTESITSHGMIGIFQKE